MAKRMHSRSLLFFEKNLALSPRAYLIVENFKSYNSIILNTAGSFENDEEAWYLEIPIIPGNTINLFKYNSVPCDFEAFSVGDKLEIRLELTNTEVINGLVIWGVK